MNGEPKFKVGNTVATPGALRAMQQAGQGWITFLDRHISGDWGDLETHDKTANEVALRDGSRILSAYNLSTGVTIWVITEADRSSTCILLPGEY
jgi:hypothetical protein